MSYEQHPTTEPRPKRPSDKLVLLAGSWADDALANFQAEMGGGSASADLRFLSEAYNDTEKEAIAGGARFGSAVVKEFDVAAAKGPEGVGNPFLDKGARRKAEGLGR